MSLQGNTPPSIFGNLGHLILTIFFTAAGPERRRLYYLLFSRRKKYF